MDISERPAGGIREQALDHKDQAFYNQISTGGLECGWKPLVMEAQGCGSKTI
jgi:hypothetical protein